jgi:hypothetical protein
MQKRPPSSTASHISREVVETIIKKKSAPSGPPPIPNNFKPKDLNKYFKKRNKEYSSDSEDSSSVSDSKSKSVSSDDDDNDEESRSNYTKSELSSFSNFSKNSPSHVDMKNQEKEPGLSSKPARYKEESKQPESTPIRKSLRFTESEDEKESRKSINKSKDSKSKNESKLKIFNFVEFLKSAKNRKLKEFLLTPVEEGVLVRCYIERDRFGTNMLSPMFTLCADLENGTGQELLVCKKIMMSRTPHYVFSIISDDLYKKREQRSKLYLGKLRSGNPGDYVFYSSLFTIGDSHTSVNYSSIFSNPRHNEPIHDFDERSTRYIDDPYHQNSKGSEHKYSEDETNISNGRKSSIFSNNGYNEDFDTRYDKLEGVSVHFNCTTRPAPSGVRGCEVCIPHPMLWNRNTSEAEINENNTFQAPITSRHLSDLFMKARTAGRQNELYDEDCFIMHERKTK